MNQSDRDWNDDARRLIVKAWGLAIPETAVANALRKERMDGWAYGVRCAAEWAKRISPEAADAILENLREETTPAEYEEKVNAA